MLFLAFLSDVWAKNREKFAPKYLFDSLNTRYTLRRLRRLVYLFALGEIWADFINKNEFLRQIIKKQFFDFYIDKIDKI
jgi:hypothetical protein